MGQFGDRARRHRGLTTVLLVMMFGQIRVFFAMSRDGLLPPVFSQIHPKFRTPGFPRFSSRSSSRWSRPSRRSASSDP